ncbi:DUF3369 domain-containing protein [Aliidiomarina halalkaliphila]|uniref:DUF3369 domain-containing protein n=1 Tax=Aliidiomarina halalkaliphila TaxID=2593535 RepID=A0A552X3C7_9GAMM|nr:DUF3369 domain-containing protein [Aliidiomarina halalkaliphila]TRW49466.1 DUF3369 domain-containing protein [Aliidiomarina halalkaliphila]
MNDHFLFADEPVQAQDALNERWKIIIVDDEPEVHAVTRLALSEFTFLGRGLEFHSAESGEEGCKLMREHPDAAIILLDVVMETDDAGLRVAKFIREDLDNHFTRIILRTGQPGQAPERTVIINYDINDYKSKTELTAQKLFTAVMSSLRSYRDIMSIEHSRRGLEKILNASTDLFSEQSMDQFVGGLVQQLGWLIGGARQVLYAEVDPEHTHEEFTVRAAFGEEADVVLNRPIKSALPKKSLMELHGVVERGQPYFNDDTAMIYCPSACRPWGGLLCLTGLSRPLADREKDLLRMFSEHVQLALNNVLRQDDLNRLLLAMNRRLILMETDVLERNPEDAHSASQIAAMLLPHLQVRDDKHTTLAVAASLLARIARLFSVRVRQGGVNPRVCFERVQRAFEGLRADPSNASRWVERALDERFERFDGSGFPEGKHGDGFAIEVQLLVFISALYGELHQGAQPEQALLSIEDDAVGWFSPQLRDAIRTHRKPIMAILQTEANYDFS